MSSQPTIVSDGVEASVSVAGKQGQALATSGGESKHRGGAGVLREGMIWFLGGGPDDSRTLIKFAILIKGLIKFYRNSYSL